MTIIVEDGSIVTDANSYVSVADLEEFALARNITLPATDPEKEALLIAAMDYLEAQRYKGNKYSRDQELQWPRSGVVIDGFTVGTDEIPTDLKKAELQLAVEAINTSLQPNVIPSAKGAVIQETVEGAVSVSYAEPVSPGAQPVFTKVDAYLSDLLASFGFQARVVRG